MSSTRRLAGLAVAALLIPTVAACSEATTADASDSAA